MTRALNPTQKRNLWLVLLGGPLAWATYFTAGYLFLETACRRLTPVSDILGMPWPSLVVILLTIATLIVIAYTGRYAYICWQQPDGPEYSRFIAQLGTLLCGLFAFVTLLTGLSALALAPCVFVP
jgi:hypothetical protein